MAENSENLVDEHLRAMRGDMADIKSRLTNVEVNLASLGQQVGALTTAVYSGNTDTDDLRRHIERIEQRLDLSDA